MSARERDGTMPSSFSRHVMHANSLDAMLRALCARGYTATIQQPDAYIAVSVRLLYWVRMRLLILASPFFSEHGLVVRLVEECKAEVGKPVE